MTEDNATHWYVAFCRNGQWTRIQRRLAEMNVECFIPEVYRTLVFIRTSKQLALSLVNSGEVNVKYMIDSLSHSLMVVPDKQMDDFRKVLDCSPEAECLTRIPFTTGGRVRVVKGPLSGVEGEVVEVQEGYFLVVKVCSFLCAKVEIPKSCLIALT